MTIKISSLVVMTAALLLGAGCKKDEANPTGSAEQAGTTGVAIPPGGTAAPNAKTVATYPDQVPQGGTKQLLQPFTVYQAADTASPVLTRVSVGQWINLKASRANWMLIEWPSGVGQMSPGWIEVKGGASDTRLSQSPSGSPVAPPVSAVVDAGTPVVADAGTPVDAGAAPGPTRRPVTLKPRH